MEDMTTTNAGKKPGHRIYIRSERKWIPVSKEYYETYMREIGAFKKKQYRQGFCKCPGTKEYMCDCDCLTCPFYKKDVFVSLDAPIYDDEGNEETLMDRLMDENALSPEKEVVDSIFLEAFGHALDQLTDREYLVYALWDMNYSLREIAEAFRWKNKQLAGYWMGKVRSKLAKYMIAWI